MQKVPQLRIFLVSPGDVNEERAVALEVLDISEYDCTSSKPLGHRRRFAKRYFAPV
jgi:hypothetical protein